MSKRYRMYPTKDQEQTLVNHCGQARFVWNLALEQNNQAKVLGQYANQRLWYKQLAEARKHTWLSEGSSSIQQQSLRDLEQAFKNWWKNPAHFGAPKFRSKNKSNQGFRIVDLKWSKVNHKWGYVHIPKCGKAKFKTSRSISEAKSARVTLDRSGRGTSRSVVCRIRLTDPAQVRLLVSTVV